MKTILRKEQNLSPQKSNNHQIQKTKKKMQLNQLMSREVTLMTQNRKEKT